MRRTGHWRLFELQRLANPTLTSGILKAARVARPESSKGVEALQVCHDLYKASGRATRRRFAMPKSGIKLVSETLGTGPELKKGDRVRLRYDIQLNRGDYLERDQETVLTIGDRTFIAGFRYGLEGMRVGGTRHFRASPHLCYRDRELARIPKNAVLIFDIKQVEIVGERGESPR
jgi:FKBP-type peptidyl-prolyl cis-trans isomerase